MRKTILSVLFALLLAANLGLVTAVPTVHAAAAWTAYDDCAYIDGQTTYNITTYEGYTNGAGGILKKYADGTNTPVTLAVTTSGTVESQLTSSYYGAETDSGTEAYSTFHDYVNMVGGMRISPSAYIDLTFTGLNPDHTYTFATTANRANSEYTTRITKFTLSDVDSATNASTSGVTVNNNLSVSFCTGYNTVNGYVARWTGIQPGSDGDFQVRLAIDSGDYAYGPAVLLLRDETGGPVNQAPEQPVLVQPLDDAMGVSTPPALEVTVTDPDSDPMDVTFYGRPVGTGTCEDFTIVVLPDTQNYTTSDSLAAIFSSQTQWIVDNETTKNIVFVTHVGDIVDTATNAAQWVRADAAMDLLDPPGIPYSVGPGNHDTGGLYSSYFGSSRFSSKSWYGGYYTSGNDNYNNYSLFSASGMDFILINLQYQSTTAMQVWADGLLKTYSNRRAIVVQHDLLNIDNSWLTQAPYNELRDNPNLFLMLCGHMHSGSDGAAYVAGTGTDGHTIHVMLADYQDFPNGGNGYLRILRFSPADDKIYATTYSPSLNSYITTSPDQMEMVYDMVCSGSATFAVIGTDNGVTSGSNASISWPGLDPDTEYEWYVDVSDGSATTTGSTWSFTTTQNIYTVTFDKNGGDTNPVPPSATTTYNGTVALPTTNPTKLGYTFASWNTAANGSGSTFTASTPVTANITVYAQYTTEGGILGDVNGDGLVNSTDALIILSCDVGLDTSEFCPMNCGDVNGDGLVNSTDALIILSYDVGISVPYPVGEPGCSSSVTPCPGCSD
jgi:uncharacterized repeat protein (TIGR02543 family)